jgi:MFS transporter, SP family, galactose:H+ symporter
MTTACAPRRRVTLVWVRPSPVVAARLLVGLAIGVASYAVPLYISELTPPDARGWLVSLNQLAITIGTVVACSETYACGI